MDVCLKFKKIKSRFLFYPKNHALAICVDIFQKTGMLLEEITDTIRTFFPGNRT